MEKFNSPPASPKIGKGGMQHLFNERVSPSHYFTSYALGYSHSTNNSCAFSLASVGDWFVCGQMCSEEPIHILNIAIKYDNDYTDENFATKFEEFCAEKVRYTHARAVAVTVTKNVFVN